MKSNVQLWRDEHGVAHVEAATEPDLYWGQGFAHATDRGLQMLLMRILGQGRLSELLDSSDEALEIDIFFRRMNWAGDTPPQFDVIADPAVLSLQRYCAGVNAAISRKCPWELRLLGADATRRKRPKFRQYFRLLVPAYRSMNSPG